MKAKGIKRMLNLSIIGIIPVIFATMIICAIGFENLLGGNLLTKAMLEGKANFTFLTILCVLSFIGLSIILTTVLGLSRYTDKIDKLDESIAENYKSKLQLDKTVEELKNKM